MESKKEHNKAEIDEKRKAKEGGTCLPGKKKGVFCCIVGLTLSKTNKKAKYLDKLIFFSCLLLFFCLYLFFYIYALSHSFCSNSPLSPFVNYKMYKQRLISA